MKLHLAKHILDIDGVAVDALIGRLQDTEGGQHARVIGARRNGMRERQVGVEELEANLRGCLQEVGSGMTLIVTDKGGRVARLTPEPGAGDSNDGPAIAWSGRRLKKTKPKARQRGGGSMADIVRENRR